MSLYYEIQDDNGVIRRGDPMEIMYIWGTNYYNDEAFERFYGSSKRRSDYLIKKWEGRLRVVSIIDEVNSGPGVHYPVAGLGAPTKRFD